MIHSYWPTSPLQTPCGTMFHYPQYHSFPYWPWLYKVGPDGERRPVDYDQSEAAKKARGDYAQDYQI